jgi:2-methylisocitrate lyase-like PEP mutase family enzyme
VSDVKISHWLEKPFNPEADPVQLLNTYGSWKTVPKKVGHSALSLTCYYVAAQLQLPDFRAHSISDLLRSRRLNAIDQYTPIIPDQGLVFLHTERSTLA